jgi:hypothetical protein
MIDSNPQNLPTNTHSFTDKDNKISVSITKDSLVNQIAIYRFLDSYACSMSEFSITDESLKSLADFINNYLEKNYEN